MADVENESVVEIQSNFRDIFIRLQFSVIFKGVKFNTSEFLSQGSAKENDILHMAPSLTRPVT